MYLTMNVMYEGCFAPDHKSVFFGPMARGVLEGRAKLKGRNCKHCRWPLSARCRQMRFGADWQGRYKASIRVNVMAVSTWPIPIIGSGGVCLEAFA
jgi:hypothetical protein